MLRIHFESSVDWLSDLVDSEWLIASALAWLCYYDGTHLNLTCVIGCLCDLHLKLKKSISFFSDFA